MWRGKAHEYIEEEIKNNALRHSASEDKKMRKESEKMYADLIKANFVPTIDPNKKKETASRL